MQEFNKTSMFSTFKTSIKILSVQMSFHRAKYVQVNVHVNVQVNVQVKVFL